MGDPCRYCRYADRPQMSLRTKRYYVSCTGLGSAANTVIPAFAGITGTLQSVLSWTPAYAGLTKVFAPAGCII